MPRMLRKCYRFMIMDRFGRDLQKMYEENAKQFSHKTVLQLGLRILDILEYVHEHEYVHGDIKASNLLLSYKNPNQVYLVDYGLAYRYCPDGVHKVYKEDPKRCHDGTMEYTSIDAHKGVAPSRRGDLEILGYCMIHWLSGHLPWEDNLKDPNFVRDSKIRCRDNISILMDKCFPGKNKPDEIAKYMEKVKVLSYEEKPVYQHFREILLQGLKAIGQKDDGVLDFGLAENGDFQRNPVQKKRRKAAAAATESTEAKMEDSESPKKKKAAISNAIAARTQKMTSPKPKKTTATRKRVQKFVFLGISKVWLAALSVAFFNVAFLLLGLHLSESHAETVLRMSIRGPDGEGSPQELAVSHTGRSGSFAVRDGPNASAAVVYDYGKLLVGYRSWRGRACYITRVDKDNMPGLDAVTETFQRRQGEDAGDKAVPLADRSILGTTINILCSSVPVFWA